jgi:hypothetical protein
MHRFRLSATLLAVVFAALQFGIPAPAYAAEPVATAETNWDGVSVNVMSVTRKGSILTVKFVALNESTDTQKVAFGFTGNDVCYAVDEESGTKYYVLTDKEGNPVASAKDWMPNSTSGLNREIEPGKTLRVWMKFPAPPPEVSSISLVLNETDPIEDVAITDQ